MQRIASVLQVTTLAMMGAIIMGMGLYLLPPVQQLSFWLPSIRILSGVLLLLSVALIILQLVTTSHPHHDIWVLACVGLPLGIVGASLTPKSVVKIVMIMAILGGSVVVTLMIAATQSGLNKLADRKGFGWMKRAGQLIRQLWLILCCLFAVAVTAGGGYFLYSFSWEVVKSGAEYVLAGMLAIPGIAIIALGLWLLYFGIRAIRDKD